MTLLELIRHNCNGAGESAMWRSVERISGFIDEHYKDNPDAISCLLKGVYSDMIGEHYNEKFGREQISSMYYVDATGIEHRAPYWADDVMDGIYSTISGLIPNCYTKWDVFVTLNMLRSDYNNLLESWFSPDGVDAKVVEMAVSFLNDTDAPHKETKIWRYFC